MKTIRLLLLAILAATSPSALAQLEEIVVTGARSDEGTAMPGTFLRRTGDFLLLQVNVTSDTREADGRRDEIYATLRTALAAANRDGTIELSVIDEGDLVIPLKVDPATVVLRPDNRPDTSATRIVAKTKIPAQETNGLALIAKLKTFIAGIKVTGRTRLDPAGDVEISVVAPNRYRDEIIALFAKDAKSITAALGEDYKIVATGIDRPVRWARMGLLELALYVPYKFEVLPSTVNTYINAPRLE